MFASPVIVGLANPIPRHIPPNIRPPAPQLLNAYQDKLRIYTRVHTFTSGFMRTCRKTVNDEVGVDETGCEVHILSILHALISAVASHA